MLARRKVLRDQLAGNGARKQPFCGQLVNVYDDILANRTVPLGGGVGKIVRFGKLPVNFQTQLFRNIEKPEFGPDWGVCRRS
jgi:hypothetical protein